MRFFRTTVLGGLVFLVPIIVVVVILGKAFGIMMKLAAPLTAWMPIDSIGGVALADLLAVAAIIMACFAAGLLARRPLAAKAVESLESGVLSSIPGYAFIKGLSESLAGKDAAQNLKPVLARFDDASQVAFEIERGTDGKVVVYVPGAPDPRSGAVFVMTEDRIERLGVSMSAAFKNISTLGRGTTGLLRSAPRNETS